MQRRLPASHAPPSASLAPQERATASSGVEERASLIAFAWSVRDIVSSNISMFETFSPEQMKAFASNMANAFEKFTLELEAVTHERDQMRRELDESIMLLREREHVSLRLSSTLAEAHAPMHINTVFCSAALISSQNIAKHIRSLQLQLSTLSTALVLNTSSIMSVMLPEKGDRNLSPVVRGDDPSSHLPVSLSMSTFPWPVSHFCCVECSSSSASAIKETFPDFISKDIMVSKIDVPRMWFHSCSAHNAENSASLLRPFISQKNQMVEDAVIRQQRDLSATLQRYPLPAVRFWSQEMLFVDTQTAVNGNMPIKIEQGRKLLQDSPVIQSLQHKIEHQAQVVNELLQEATACSMWLIDDIMGEEALATKSFIEGIEVGPILIQDVQHVCSIANDSFEACAALHVHAAATAIDRHNNHIEFKQQSESYSRMISELKSLRLELAKKAELVSARDMEIESLREQMQTLTSESASSQALQSELQIVVSENATLRERVQKLEMRILNQPTRNQRQPSDAHQQIECLIYIAKVDYNGDGPHQLTLRKDDKIAVFVEDGLGWARGFCNGRLGLFPSILCEKTSHVELVTLNSDNLSSLEAAFARALSS